MKRMGAVELGGLQRRVAFYGGSFDPPHKAHLAVARAAQKALSLDEVLFAPVGTQPLKPDGATASFADRAAMVRLAIAGEPGFSLSEMDAPRPDGRANYSFDTLARLKTELGADCRLFFLMGADSFKNLRQWHRAKELPFLVTLVVAARPGEALGALEEKLPEGLAVQRVGGQVLSNGMALEKFAVRNKDGTVAPLYLLPGLDYDVSATQLRELLRSGSPEAKDALPAGVADYLRRHHLYQRFTGRNATR